MKMKFLGCAIGISALGVLGAWGAGCSQPNTQCTVGTATFSPYVGKFYLQGTIEGTDPGYCNFLPVDPDDPNATPNYFGVLGGDLVGMQTYNPNSGGVPDLSTKALAIQLSLVGGLLYPEFEPTDREQLRAYAKGNFAGLEPDGSNLCTVPTLAPAQVTHPQVDPSANGTECGGDHHCFSGICDVTSGTCSDPLPLGSGCAEDYHCDTGICDVATGSCSDPLPGGADCAADYHCETGFICDPTDAFCVAPLDNDAACGDNSHCASGFCNPISGACGDPQCCGDGYCDAASEDCTSCEADCGACPTCGDGACNGTEDCATCPEDGCCCGDGTCDAATEDCVSCGADCASPCGACGDAVCDAGEDCTTCPSDCGGCCGNGQCESDASENCVTCDSDCGACAQYPLGQTVEWSNVQIYVTAAYLGNQAKGTFTYTYNDGYDDCSATYNVVMLWPAIGCEKVMFLKDRIPVNAADVCAEAAVCDPYAPGRPDCVECDPAVDGEEICLPLGVGEPEDKLCDAEPDLEPQYALPFGSGISPEINVQCDPALLECVIRGESIPAFK